MRKSPWDTAGTALCPSTMLAKPRAMAEALVRHAELSGYGKPLHVIADPRGPGDVEPGRTRTWWLSPQRWLPVYRCGKIIVTSRYRARSTATPPGTGAVLLVGLCVQKGLDPWAADALPAAGRNPSWFRTAEAHWVWDDFLPEMASGHIEPLAVNAEAIGGCPLTVVLEARDPYGTGGGETLTFTWSRGEMSAPSTPSRRSRSGATRELSSAGTLAALAQRLSHSRHLGDLWIDLAIGFHLRIDRAGSGPMLWDESRVWASACRPWSLWLR